MRISPGPRKPLIVLIREHQAENNALTTIERALKYYECHYRENIEAMEPAVRDYLDMEHRHMKK